MSRPRLQQNTTAKKNGCFNLYLKDELLQALCKEALRRVNNGSANTLALAPIIREFIEEGLKRRS